MKLNLVIGFLYFTPWKKCCFFSGPPWPQGVLGGKFNATWLVSSCGPSLRAQGIDHGSFWKSIQGGVPKGAGLVGGYTYWESGDFPVNSQGTKGETSWQKLI